MKNLKWCVSFLVIFTCNIGFSTVRICGNHTYPDGHTARVCAYFYAKDTKCDSADMLAIVSQSGGFPGGWTCQSDNFGIATANSGDASLIRTPDGKAYLTVNGESTQVGSDALKKYIKKVQRETANMRINTQAVQNAIGVFLDSDNGYVSDERLKKLSTELGVPIVVTRGWNPKDEPGYHQSKLTGKAAEPRGSASSGSRQTHECSLPDCSCRVVSSSGDSLCEGGIEEETATGTHYCKCGRFGPQMIQGGGAGGEFMVDTGSMPAPQAHDPIGAASQTVPGQQGRGTPETCVAEYEAAIGTEVFFRPDRKITGVWKAKPGPRTRFQKPGAIVADVNGCLYGCTGNVWEPLDCPGRDFSNPETYPLNFKMAASCGSTNTSGLAWRLLNESRGGAMETPPQKVPLSRFALVQKTSRPPESHDPGDGQRAAKLDCWVDENPNGMFPKLKCCLVVETLPTDSHTLSPMDVPDVPMCTSHRSAASPDVQDGSIVLRTDDGKDYCLNPSGSFGTCAAGFGIKEKGTR